MSLLSEKKQWIRVWGTSIFGSLGNYTTRISPLNEKKRWIRVWGTSISGSLRNYTSRMLTHEERWIRVLKTEGHGCPASAQFYQAIVHGKKGNIYRNRDEKRAIGDNEFCKPNWWSETWFIIISTVPPSMPKRFSNRKQRKEEIGSMSWQKWSIRLPHSSSAKEKIFSWTLECPLIKIPILLWWLPYFAAEFHSQASKWCSD